MELSSSKTKKVLMFSQKKLFIYFRKWNFEKKPTLKKILIFRKMERSSPKLNIFLIFFLKKNFSYISGGNLQSPKNKNFLYFF